MKQFLTDDQKEKFTKVVIKEDIMDETIGFGAEMYCSDFNRSGLYGIYCKTTSG